MNRDNRKSISVPHSAGGGGLFQDEERVGNDMLMIRSAIKKRWPISDELKRRLIARMGEIIDSEHSDSRDAIGAAKVIATAEGQNQCDELKLIPDQVDHTHNLGFSPRAVADELRADAGYLEYQRQKALAEDSGQPVVIAD